ncbi:alpha/beta fold hydrolase [Xanthobacter sp. DSM 24535]|uniref:alpha/beta hydrolase n=1 Tax=Roseixanthobacter psychrophilus TaxID=3119917 RepID=UPI003728698C
MISRRTLLAAGACGLLLTGSRRLGAAPAFAVDERPWSHGGLSGTLAIARDGRAAGPAVLLLPGSGPLDRDGNGPAISTDLYRQLAFGLAGAGYRVLRYDKRGVGASRALVAREEDLRFDQYVDDSIGALQSLAGREDVSSLILIGHSEGASVATRTAARVPVAGLVLLAGAGRPLADILRDQFIAMNLPDSTLDTALTILRTVAAGGRVRDVPAALRMAFRPSVQPFLASECAVDPAHDLSRVRAPTLLVQGLRDLQVGGQDLAALRRGRPDAQVVTLADANHMFKVAPEDRAANFALYKNRTAPLHPGVLPALVRFIETQA